jgi:hypothetical protein
MKRKLLLYACFVLGSLDAFSQTVGEGIRLYDREKFASASAMLKQVLMANPSDIKAGFWLMRSYLSMGALSQASGVPTQVNETVRTEPLYKVMEGMTALQKGDSLTAQSYFLAALGDSRKKDPAIQLAIAQAQIDADRGNLYYALELLNEAERRDRKNPAIYIAMGDAYRKLYNGSEAVRSYSTSLELDKTNPVPYYKMGKIYQTQNNAEVFNEFYNKTLAADPAFAPAYYQQYYAWYFKDVTKALEPLQQFIILADPDVKNSYLLTDLLYINKKYRASIDQAQKILVAEKDSVKPRIYKLLAYSYDGISDSMNADTYLSKYFSVAHDSTIAPDDLSLMAKLLEKRGQDSMALVWLTRAYRLEKDSSRQTDLTRKLISFTATRKQYADQAYWYEQLYNRQVPLSNVDIFNWGISNYNAQIYLMADSVFSIYQAKYPEQTFGYYWRARSNAAIDTAMEMGLALPHYENLVKVEKDTANANNRKWLIQAYGYIAAYKVNAQKAYGEAFSYYDKILVLDPGNDDAEKYKDVLAKIIDRTSGEKQSEDEADENKNKNKVLDKNPPGQK